MKKVILLIIVMISFISMKAQNHSIYAFLVIDAGFTPILITESSETPSNAMKGFDFKKNYLRDSEGNEIKFNNFLPLLGYIQTIGWSVPDIEKQLKDNQASTIKGRAVFLLKREVSEQEWLEWIKNGLKKK